MIREVTAPRILDFPSWLTSKILVQPSVSGCELPRAGEWRKKRLAISIRTAQNCAVKMLVDEILKQLELKPWCAVFGDEVERVWPIVPSEMEKREQAIHDFARDLGLKAKIKGNGSRIYFQRLEPSAMDELADEIGEWLSRMPSYTLFGNPLREAFPDDETDPESRDRRITEFARRHGWRVVIFDIGCTFAKAAE
jgi:hypothetical protein